MSDKKIEQFWRNATAEDVAEIAKTCKPKDARIRDFEYQEWREVELSGFVCRATYNWVTLCSGSYQLCQVYDPPQWFLDKPDPGEGWRLLEKFPPEELQPEDDWWGLESKDWLPSRRACRGEQQDHDVWYRRRIEPNVPEIPDSCERKKLEAGKEYLLPSGLVLIVHNESIEVKHD